MGPGDEFLASKLKNQFNQMFVVIILCYLTVNIFNFTIGPLNSWKILKLSPVQCARVTIFYSDGSTNTWGILFICVNCYNVFEYENWE